ncbi:MAG: hypothetical protein IPJ17_15935 [Holophagales bacterium]|nr:MAG: hypothetical protein IPJ17_15935 [Holophagales bacterium]
MPFPSRVARLVVAALAFVVLGPARAQTTAASPPAPEVGRKLIEIYRVAPGQHEAFLRAIALFDEANRRAGVPPRQLYVHSDGASWDFLLVQDADYPEGKGALVGQAFREMQLPGGPRFFTEFRKLLLEHTDTFAAGPTTAAAWLATLDAAPRSRPLDGASAGSLRTYALRDTLALGGAPRWDDLTVDDGARRLYLAHDTAVEVVDLGTRRVVGRVDGLAGAHGIALAPELGRGFVASGDQGTVVAFDLATLQRTHQTKVGGEPDAITFEPTTRRLAVWNGGTSAVAVLDAVSLRELVVVPLGATPELAVADGAGALFVHLGDPAEIARLDVAAAAPRIGARFALPGCESPRGLAFDPQARRLFSACGNGRLLVVDATSGRILDSGAIGRGVDAVVFDAPHARVLAASPEGSVTIFAVSPGGALGAPREVQTRATARTLALDPRDGALWLPAADLELDWSARRAAFAADGLKLYVFEPVAE